MRLKGITAIFSAIALAALVATAPVAVADRSGACEITSPPQGWPDGTSQGFNTNLHHGINSDWRLHVRPKGKVRAVMLFVDFPNARASDNAAPYDTTDAYHDFLGPESEAWFDTASYGRFNLEIDPVHKWYRMSREDHEYGMERVIDIETQRRYLGEAVRLADRDVNFKRYDIVYLVPSRNASAIPASPEYNDYAGEVRADRTRITQGVTFGQDMWAWGYKIVNHETGHLIGLPESYNASGVPDFHSYVGGWDVMGAILGPAPDLMAWNKWKLGWVRDNQIDCVARRGTSTHRLDPIEERNGTKAVVVRTGRYTAWVAELRRPLGVDTAICDPGVLVYKVDASIPNGDGSIRVYDADPGSGNDHPCTELDVGALNTGDRFEQDGVAIEVLREEEDKAVVRVRRR